MGLRIEVLRIRNLVLVRKCVKPWTNGYGESRKVEFRYADKTQTRHMSAFDVLCIINAMRQINPDIAIFDTEANILWENKDFEGLRKHANTCNKAYKENAQKGNQNTHFNGVDLGGIFDQMFGGKK